MFLFKKKDKKKSHRTISQDKVYKKNDLLEIKLPDDFSTIVLPQLIDYEYEKSEDDSIMNHSDSKNQQNRISREGWLPATRLNNDHIQDTLVDTTNITASSLIQCKSNQSISLSSSCGDTITSKEGSIIEQGSFEIDDKSFLPERKNYVPNLRINRPSFKNRHHPRFKVLFINQNMNDLLMLDKISLLSNNDEEEKEMNEMELSSTSFSTTSSTSSSSMSKKEKNSISSLIQSDQSITLEEVQSNPIESSSVNIEIGILTIPENNNENNNNNDNNNSKERRKINNKRSDDKKINNKQKLRQPKVYKNNNNSIIKPINNNNSVNNNASMIPQRPKSINITKDSNIPKVINTKNKKPNNQTQNQMNQISKLNSKIPVRSNQV